MQELQDGVKEHHLT